MLSSPASVFPITSCTPACQKDEEATRTWEKSFLHFPCHAIRCFALIFLVHRHINNTRGTPGRKICSCTSSQWRLRKKEISVWKAEFNSVATFRSGTPPWAVLTTLWLGLAVAVLVHKTSSLVQHLHAGPNPSRSTQEAAAGMRILQPKSPASHISLLAKQCMAVSTLFTAHSQPRGFLRLR